MSNKPEFKDSIINGFIKYEAVLNQFSKGVWKSSGVSELLNLVKGEVDKEPLDTAKEFNNKTKIEIEENLQADVIEEAKRELGKYQETINTVDNIISGKFEVDYNIDLIKCRNKFKDDKEITIKSYWKIIEELKDVYEVITNIPDLHETLVEELFEGWTDDQRVSLISKLIDDKNVANNLFNSQIEDKSYEYGYVAGYLCGFIFSLNKFSEPKKIADKVKPNLKLMKLVNKNLGKTFRKLLEKLKTLKIRGTNHETVEQLLQKLGKGLAIVQSLNNFSDFCTVDLGARIGTAVMRIDFSRKKKGSNKQKNLPFSY